MPETKTRPAILPGTKPDISPGPDPSWEPVIDPDWLCPDQKDKVKRRIEKEIGV
jgi:hypothetical protein